MSSEWPEPHKQRHTVTRMWHRLMDEHETADVPYPMVRAYVAIAPGQGSDPSL